MDIISTRAKANSAKATFVPVRDKAAAKFPMIWMNLSKFIAWINKIYCLLKLLNDNLISRDNSVDIIYVWPDVYFYFKTKDYFV